MASRRPIYTFQLTRYDTESNEKNLFAVLCEWLTPLTTFINWQVFWISNCCILWKSVSDQDFLIVIHSNILSGIHGYELLLQIKDHVIVISPPGAPQAIFHDGFWKSDHDFLIVFLSNFLSEMHSFRDNKVSLPTGYDVIMISRLGALQAIFMTDSERATMTSW